MVSGAPVLVADAVMDRLAVAEAGRVFQVAGDLPGPRPRFEPRNMSFGEGLDRWDLHSPAPDQGGASSWPAAAGSSCGGRS